MACAGATPRRSSRRTIARPTSSWSTREQLLAGQDGNSRALYEPYYKGWEPRIGFAYRQGDRWVFRGGYGITQYMEGTGANLRLPLNPPFFFESQIAYDPTSGAGTIATGFEGLQALDRPSGQLRAWDPNLRPQFTQQWNLFVEYLLGPRASVNVGYVGNKSKYLVTPVEGNQPLPGHRRSRPRGCRCSSAGRCTRSTR